LVEASEQRLEAVHWLSRSVPPPRLSDEVDELWTTPFFIDYGTSIWHESKWGNRFSLMNSEVDV